MHSLLEIQGAFIADWLTACSCTDTDRSSKDTDIQSHTLLSLSAKAVTVSSFTVSNARDTKSLPPSTTHLTYSPVPKQVKASTLSARALSRAWHLAKKSKKRLAWRPRMSWTLPLSADLSLDKAITVLRSRQHSREESEAPALASVSGPPASAPPGGATNRGLDRGVRV